MRLSILNVVEVVKSCRNQVAQPHFFILRTQCAHLHFSFLISCVPSVASEQSSSAHFSF